MTRIAPAIGVVAAWFAAMAFSNDVALAISQPAVARTLAADAFLAEVLLVIVAAPLTGVALFRQPKRLAIAGATFVALSFLVALAVSLHSGYPASLVVRSHAVLAVVGIALASLGTFARSTCGSELDAAGLALTTSVVAAAAILVGGPGTAELTERTIDAALLANPLIAITAAAEMDLLRSELLYTLAPVSHRRFTYPAWHVTTGTYGAIALCAFAFTFFGTRQKGPVE